MTEICRAAIELRLREAAHVGRHRDEAAALLACARGSHRGIERGKPCDVYSGGAVEAPQ